MNALIHLWWDTEKPITPRDATANLLVGIACAVCVLLDWRLGLGTYGRWYLGAFAALCIPWGVLALRIGMDSARARPLRHAGDIVAWVILVGFALLAWLNLEPAEFAPTWTLAAFVVATAVRAFAALRKLNAAEAPHSSQNA